jgi:hypothetical protein
MNTAQRRNLRAIGEAIRRLRGELQAWSQPLFVSA